ncbi:DUF2750 domain-containing protein [Shewanella avicenniae]|uniref:DUF2750 domain-containing protein n=1 Tax=Shewanella avicenniae TaxID=2814294 RepID=A0ABX7QT74_9GAMM|nr:DUF2750 domain-containing protein [Shewanella avicenniae]QSX34681.1 DUF2750 domain-containing protein [Shewanella avicenniae]
MKDTSKTPDFSHMTPEQRYQYLVEQTKANKELWIIQDDDGCVMLTTDDEDCIPVWPSEAAALQWTKDEWQDCRPLSISLSDWLERWVPGMEDDELFVAVFPLEDDLGVVVPPHELESQFKPKTKH